MKIKRILKGAGIRSSYGTIGACAVTLVEDDLNVLVDTGHFGNRDNLKYSLKKEGVEPSMIDAVVLTHINWDHCLNIDLFPDAQIIIGKEELSLGTLSGVPDGLSDTFKNYLKTMKVNPVENDYKITPNVTVVSTPGHTPGHIAVKALDKKFLTVISGDAIPNLRAYSRGMPDFVFSNLEEAKKSIDLIKNMNPDMIIPGHDTPFNINGYIEMEDIDVILRNGKYEENLIITLKKVEGDRPVIYNE